MRSKSSRRTFLKYLFGAALGAGLSQSAKTFAADAVLDEPYKTYLPMVARPALYKNIIFLHHSTGAGLIWGGNVRPLFTGKGYDFWDHDYNSPGLSLPSGDQAGYNYNVPDDNTDPIGYNTIFQQPYYSTPPHPESPQNCFSGLMRHDVIIFKSCFPASAIWSDQMLEDYKTYYRTIRARTDLYKNHIFIAFSTPPLHPCSTNVDDAKRARAFANWLVSSEYLNGHSNLFVFNFFNYLARADDGSAEANMLKAAYRPDYCDSHPNDLANQTIGPIFVDFVDAAIKSYVS